ncbi:RWD domain-containing protein 4 isoform X1 [Ostrinia furnacalis]|uniref:RWD domain-containing protein 4 isoform X1 n=1 Tax=Ostrinia furnacalis TaxID=93504 RepID=UPI00103FE115|nr:RWD domain-containing protein 4 isoform X1 [Ostrinia furnacalis]XP_028168008.1 RWD domain-containing protein 4 isoform X1 [Ostrinia furnacalis]
MCDDAEQQAEEVEVLKSIYDGDEGFKQVDSKTYQYKYVDGEKSFILEITWGPTYPTEKPNFNLEIFYNQHLIPSVKEKILSIVNAEAEQWIGCAMTYTLFECLKEKVPEILAEQTEEAIVSSRVEKIVIEDQVDTSKKTEKKEQLTKAQKRRAWDKAEIGRGGEKPRGWDWVDIVKHLSQAPHQPAPTS